ncbi:response regulator [Stenotrophomonas sp.]|jgi:FixJ family two-component response regulator|uniref:response regulator transcription factor n=1 Tax=Stenotrophomonas sp. TaxID=69392 RepID=UPI0028ACE889|nr:response regulator [Stenotrophomonas sp.]
MKPLYRIAIVDDDDGVRQSLSSLVRSLGHEVRTYASAAAFLADDGDAPDCLLTDIQMPQMSGDQLQAALIERGCRFPMLFMTAFPNDAVRDRVMGRGGRAFLVKPVDGEAMSQCLAEALHCVARTV